MSTFDRISNIKRCEETVTVDLGDYAQAYRGATFDVWVTPTQAHLDRLTGIDAWLQEQTDAAKKVRDALPANERAAKEKDLLGKINRQWEDMWLDWYADTWLNVEREEAYQIRDHLKECDPAAWSWLTDRTTKTIGEFRQRKLKN